METKPQAEKPVLAWDGDRWVRAMWVPRHTKEQQSDSDWYDHNEADDTYYWPEGWYELQTHGGDDMLWNLTNGATAWQDLPPEPLFNEDPLYEQAVKLMREAPEYACISRIQRKLMIGYNRASRIMDAMIERGVIARTSTFEGVTYTVRPVV